MATMTSIASKASLSCILSKTQQSTITTAHIACKRWIVLTEEDHKWLAASFNPMTVPAVPEFRDEILDLAHTLINRTLDKYQWMSTARLLNDVIQSLKEDGGSGGIIQFVFYSACLRVFLENYVECGWTKDAFENRVRAALTQA